MIKMNSRKEMPEPIVIAQTGDKSGLELATAAGLERTDFKAMTKDELI